MALQSSGQLSFNQIRDEFGWGINRLGQYRRDDAAFSNKTLGDLRNMPLDDNIPVGGTIKFSDFHSAKLNTVVDCHSGGTEFRVDGRSRYNGGGSGVRCVGGFRTRPSDTAEAPTGGVRGKRVRIHVNKTLGSDNSNDDRICALTTGGWDNETELWVDVGDEGAIFGAGGNGGTGGANGTGGHGGTGQEGTSALGIQYGTDEEVTRVDVSGGGMIVCGFGGGGGGGGVENSDGGGWRDDAEEQKGSGGGGGGGAGLPGGAGGGRWGSWGSNGSAGTTPNFNSNREGGAGGSGGGSAGEAIGGRGGRGGDTEGNPETGKQSGSNERASGGGTGANGAAIRKTSNSIKWAFDSGSSSRTHGSTNSTGVVGN